MAKDTSSATFKNDVISSKTPVLVDFWAPWCGPCRMVAPILDELSPVYEGKVNIVKLNTDENQDIANEYGIRSIPTMIIFKDGKVFAQRVGALPKSGIEEFIKSAM